MASSANQSHVLANQPMHTHRKNRSAHAHNHLWRIIKLSMLVIAAAGATIYPLYWCSMSYIDDNDVFATAPLADGHNDLPIWLRAFYNNSIKSLTESSSIDGQVDLPRLREGKIRAQFWSVYVPCPRVSDNHTDEVYHEIIHDTIQQIDLVNRLIEKFPAHLQHTTSSHDFWRTFIKSDRIASTMGVEGLHQIGNSASVLRVYHKLGVRYAALTHDCHNMYADSSEPPTALHGGLSEAGIEIIREMNRIGMVVDLSHSSADTARAAIRHSRAPVVFSHSSSYSICPHPRNVPDDVLLSLKHNRGIVMVTFYPKYTNCLAPQNATLEDVASHIEYIGRIIGYEHVGIGADFDGMDVGVKGLEDVSKYPSLIRELQRRGMKPKTLRGIMGVNVLRVLKEAEDTAQKMKDIAPLEDNVKPFFG